MRTITADDLWGLARVGPPEPLPDGDRAVVTVTGYDEDHPTGRSALWLVAVDGSRQRLTRPDRSATSPAVSPDGTMLAFLAKDGDGDAAAQVHVMRLDGGEAARLCDLPLGARAILWLPAGTGLVVSGPLYRSHPTIDGSAEERDRRKEGKPEAIVTEDRMYRFWKRWLAGDTIDHFFRVALDPRGRALFERRGFVRTQMLVAIPGTRKTLALKLSR